MILSILFFFLPVSFHAEALVLALGTCQSAQRRGMPCPEGLFEIRLKYLMALRTDIRDSFEIKGRYTERIRNDYNSPEGKKPPYSCGDPQNYGYPLNDANRNPCDQQNRVQLSHFLLVFHYVSYITDRFNGEIFNAFELPLDPAEHVQFCLSFTYFLTKKLLMLFKQNGDDTAGVLFRQQFSYAAERDTGVTKKADDLHPFEVIL